MGYRLVQSDQARHLKQASPRCHSPIHSNVPLSQRRRDAAADGRELELEPCPKLHSAAQVRELPKPPRPQQTRVILNGSNRTFIHVGTYRAVLQKKKSATTTCSGCSPPVCNPRLHLLHVACTYVGREDLEAHSYLVMIPIHHPAPSSDSARNQTPEDSHGPIS
jgi:hypothetical protein